eukprot:CAMPEP_0197634074 /NCGR_PEP_ID=MMETSP1338-20131121/10278_1 /TAXON_ID=43686 ORGANISM="Pelagodinium beii, Strain RCC1491" /NCGR_SAMPLE_ID=MMETSP1338 /ASSEMBLY_ACC=CAM_ASM_000754 /LENGTH=242 /DNA_ID=CAMNT_0043205873 /DNA_START=33 /DNA_END=757 /DNA_ORIENTATION=-
MALARQSVGAMAVRLAPSCRDARPVGACKNLLSPSSTWDFPLSRSEKVQRLLKLYEDEVDRNKALESELTFETQSLQAECGSLDLELERSRQDVERLEAEVTTLTSLLGEHQEELARLECVQEENAQLKQSCHWDNGKGSPSSPCASNQSAETELRSRSRSPSAARRRWSAAGFEKVLRSIKRSADASEMQKAQDVPHLDLRRKASIAMMKAGMGNAHLSEGMRCRSASSSNAHARQLCQDA